MGGGIMPILEEEKRKFFGFLDSILKQNSTETLLEDTKKEGELKKEGGDRDMADEKKLEDMERRLQELSDSFTKDKKTLEDSHKAAIAEVEKAKKVMLEDSTGKFSTIKLDDKDVSISDVIVDMLEAIPTEVRVNLEEKSHIEKNTDPNKKYLSDKEVEQYAKDNKMTYQEACSVLVKEGKIEV